VLKVLLGFFLLLTAKGEKREMNKGKNCSTKGAWPG
jgi:hypothetical protein